MAEIEDIKEVSEEKSGDTKSKLIEFLYLNIPFAMYLFIIGIYGPVSKLQLRTIA